MPIRSPSNCLSPAPLAIGLTYEVNSSFWQIIEFCPPRTSGKGKEESCIKVCVSVHHKDLPSGATKEHILSMTDRFTVYPTEIVVECNIEFIQIVGRSIHANDVSYRAMRGMMNTFRVHSALTVGRVHSFCAIDPIKHIESPHSLHADSKHHFSSWRINVCGMQRHTPYAIEQDTSSAEWVRSRTNMVRGRSRFRLGIGLCLRIS
jgi:hypothetical protein